MACGTAEPTHQRSAPGGRPQTLADARTDTHEDTLTFFLRDYRAFTEGTLVRPGGTLVWWGGSPLR